MFRHHSSARLRTRAAAPAARRYSGWVFLATLLCLHLGTTPAVAVERTLKILAPVKAVSGQHVRISIRAGTDAGDGEHILFLHIDFSEDGGATWRTFTYNQDLGVSEICDYRFLTGAPGSRFAVRARAAFRGGRSGDVDYRGQPIDWNGSWTRWDAPPARLVEVEVE